MQRYLLYAQRAPMPTVLKRTAPGEAGANIGEG
jgi:hypothetical protein